MTTDGNTATPRRAPAAGHGNRAETPSRWIAVDPAPIAAWNAANAKARAEHARNLARDARESSRSP